MSFELRVVIKHRAPNGALRRHCRDARVSDHVSHKAPSAKRCIKTCPCGLPDQPNLEVIKHRAPNGALRPGKPVTDDDFVWDVIKHRAPNGALRLDTHSLSGRRWLPRHKAPSAKRCIKTCNSPHLHSSQLIGHKAPSAKRCIKTRSP